MNAEYVWWVIVLLVVGGGAIAFLALGQVPEIEDGWEPADEDAREAAARGTEIEDHPGPAQPTDPAAPGSPSSEDQGSPVSTTVPGPGDPSSASDTP